MSRENLVQLRYNGQEHGSRVPEQRDLVETLYNAALKRREDAARDLQFAESHLEGVDAELAAIEIVDWIDLEILSHDKLIDAINRVIKVTGLEASDFNW